MTARNDYRVDGNSIVLRLTQGKETVIDAVDIDTVRHLRWYTIIGRRSFYAMAKARNDDGSRKMVALHRLLMGEPKEFFVDHRDGDGLNNTRHNLRLATVKQNAQNKRRPSNNKSGLKGVSWHAQAGKWRACIRHEKRLISLGLHQTKEAAHTAYLEAARRLQGDFARSG